MTMTYLTKIGYNVDFLKYVVLLQTIIATVLVIYTLFRFIIFLIPEKRLFYKSIIFIINSLL